MTGNIGPRMNAPKGFPKPAKNDHEAGPSRTAHGKPDSAPAQARIDWERLAKTGKGDFGHAPEHIPGQAAPASLRNQPRLQTIPEGRPCAESTAAAAYSGESSSGSGMRAMDEMFAKLGGNRKDVQKDLSSHEEYDKACDRNPFIKAHLDPELPSPRAGMPKDHWLDRPGPDLSGPQQRADSR